MSDLMSFLEERLAEDPAPASAVEGASRMFGKLVELHGSAGSPEVTDESRPMLLALAAAYSDHPNFDPDWAE